MNENKHAIAFRQSKLKSAEVIQIHLEGWIGEIMGFGDKTQHNGLLILTSERVCFYRKGFFGEVLETIPLLKITSVEMMSRMSYRLLRLHTSHDQLEFKTFEPKKIFDDFYERLEGLRNDRETPAISATQPGASLAEQLVKLGELCQKGMLSVEEFEKLKKDLFTKN